jgi:hypothetical protein
MSLASEIKFSNMFLQLLICVFIPISGAIALKRGFSVSKILPDPLGYLVRNLNPILEPLADQVNQDPSWPPGQMTGLQLRDHIIDALNDNCLEWPMNF